MKEADAKKVRQDDGGEQEPRTNGVHKANGDSNGLAENVEAAK